MPPHRPSKSRLKNFVHGAHSTRLDGHLCTAFYFPHGFSIKSQQRLWFLCQAVGLELFQVIDEPEQFTGRRLRVKTYSVTPETGRRYSDVELFLPAIRNASVQAIETVDDFCAEEG